MSGPAAALGADSAIDITAAPEGAQGAANRLLGSFVLCILPSATQNVGVTHERERLVHHRHYPNDQNAEVRTPPHNYRITN